MDVLGFIDRIPYSQRIVEEQAKRPFPANALEQLELASKAVFHSWNGKRAHDYRNAAGIAHDLGTAVNVVAMVFGNLGNDYGTGVMTTRNVTVSIVRSLRSLTPQQ